MSKVEVRQETKMVEKTILVEEPGETKYTLTLSEDEARAVHALLGRCAGSRGNNDFYTGRLYSDLNYALVEQRVITRFGGSNVRLEDAEGNIIPTIFIKEGK